ncbi:Hsp70 protein-domain-containing protein [Aspergillus heterothallicus]
MRRTRQRRSNRLANQPTPCSSSSLLPFLFLALVFALGASACTGETPDTPAEKIIGIHVGRRESRVGGVKDGKITIFTGDAENAANVPCAVAWTDEEGGLVVGEAALRSDSPNLLPAVLDMGQKFSSSQGSVPGEETAIRYTLQNNRPAIQTTINKTTHTFHPEEIYAPLLTALLHIAETEIGPNITSAVISLPPGLTETDRESISSAGNLAGLPIIRQMNETTSTLLALGLDEISYDRERYALMFDMDGAHAFDLSIVEIDMGVMDTLAQYYTGLLMEIAGDSQTHFGQGAEDGPGEEEILDLTGVYIPHDTHIDPARGSLDAIDEVLRRANLSIGDLTDIVFSGDGAQYEGIPGRVEEYLTPSLSGLNEKDNEIPALNVANSPILPLAPIWGASLLASRMVEEDWVPCCCSTSRPALGVGVNGGEVIEIIPSCADLPVRGSEVFPGSCNASTSHNSTLVQIFFRNQPVVDYHAMIEFGEFYTPDTAVTDVLLTEVEVPTFCGQGQEEPRIEVEMFLSRQMELVIKVTSLAGEGGRIGEEVVLSFPDPGFACGRERGFPRNYTVSLNQGVDLEARYQVDLRGFVGGVRAQRPVLAKTDVYTPWP